MTTPDVAPFRVPDDALASMLRARASRVPATAGATVTARVHAEIAKPRANHLFAFLPIGDRAGSMSGLAGWALAIAAAVIVIAVLGGRQPDRPAATPGGSAAQGVTLATLPPLGTPEPGASGIPGASGDPQGPMHGRPIDGAALTDALASGSLDGRLVLVEGRLVPEQAICDSAEPCPAYWFETLPDVPVYWPGETGTGEWQNGRFLVRPANGRLELLGRLVGGLSNPVSVQVALNDRRGYPNASSPFDILPVEGYLTSDCEDTGSCAVAGPYLADAAPGRRGPMGGQGAVAVVEPAPAPDASGLVEGPFLVRFERVPDACPRLALCTAPGWGANPTVLGRYQASLVVDVVLP